MGAEVPLTLTIKALDKASGPLRAMTARLNKITSPFKAFGKDFSEFSKAANLGGVVQGFKGVGSAVSGVGREAVALGAKIFAMAGVAGFALFSIVKGAVDAGDKLGEMAQRVGLSVDVYASLSHAAAQADIDQEAFNGAMDQFNKRLGEAKAGSGGLLTFLNKVSPTLAKQVKGAKTTEEALSLMTDAMSAIKDPAKRAALSAAAFGKSGLQMGQFLGQGSAAIQEQMAAFMALAGSQEAFAKNAGELDNAMRETEVAFLGLRSAAMGALFPAFTKLSKVLTDFIVKNRAGIAKWAKDTGAAIQAWVDGGGIDRVVEGLRAFGEKAAWLFEKIGGLKGVFIAVAAVMAGPLIVSVLGLIPALVSLGIALYPLATALLPFLAAAAPFLIVAAAIAAVGTLIWLNWKPINALVLELMTTLGAFWDIAMGIVTLDLGRVINGWTTAIESFKASLMPAIALLSQVAGGGIMLDLLNIAAGDSIVRAATGKPLGAASARVDPASVSSGGGESRVSVDFSNVPRGVAVSVDRNSSQPIDLSVGRSMSGG